MAEQTYRITFRYDGGDVHDVLGTEFVRVADQDEVDRFVQDHREWPHSTSVAVDRIVAGRDGLPHVGSPDGPVCLPAKAA